MKDIFLEIGLFISILFVGAIAVSWILIVVALSILTEAIGLSLGLIIKK